MRILPPFKLAVCHSGSFLKICTSTRPWKSFCWIYPNFNLIHHKSFCPVLFTQLPSTPITLCSDAVWVAYFHQTGSLYHVSVHRYTHTWELFRQMLQYFRLPWNMREDTPMTRAFFFFFFIILPLLFEMGTSLYCFLFILWLYYIVKIYIFFVSLYAIYTLYILFW